MKRSMVVLLLSSLLACGQRRAPPVTRASPAVSASPSAESVALPPAALPAPVPPPPAAPPPATVERLAVPGDLPASIVRGLDARAPTTVFLPGLCSNANAYLQHFPEAARRAGGVVAIDGDTPCVGAPGFRSFTWDVNKQRARIEAALLAAGMTDIPREGITIVGYSQGATIAEKLAYGAPARYTRFVLIGAPTEPSLESLRRAQGVVTLSCSLDATQRMKGAARRLQGAGVPSTYLEMRGCTHGNIASGEETFRSAFDFLAAAPSR